MTICVDNEALYVIFLTCTSTLSGFYRRSDRMLRYDITTRALKVKNPTFDDLNGVGG
jgi:hypothetical protein